MASVSYTHLDVYKRQVFYMSDEEVDKELEAFGFPAPPELCKAGSYIQTTPGKEQDEIRKKNDVVLIPIGCTEDHGPMNPSGMDTFMAVSYTHLDVYKRQILVKENIYKSAFCKGADIII